LAADVFEKKPAKEVSVMKKSFIAAGALLSLAFTASAWAAPQILEAPESLSAEGVPAPVRKGTGTYIVQLSGDPILAYEGDIRGYKATKPGKGKKVNPNSAHVKKYAARLESQHDDAVARVGGEKIYSYKYSFNGFAARMTAAEAEALKNRGDVLAVWEDEYLEIETNSTPDYLDLTEGSEPWSKGYAGEDVVVGIIDTGVVPEHPSFADVPTPKKGNKGPLIPYDAPPATWTGSGTGSGCEFGNSAFNPDDAPAECSNKLLTAKCYVAGFSNVVDPSLPCGGDGAFIVPDEFLSARDASDHGSHTASTAAGNYGVEASIDNEPLGMVSGMAPRARVAVYKICWLAPGATNFSCATSDAMMAIDDAVADGVDVLNYSIGGSGTAFVGADDIAFLFAADANVFVATSNGNAGPGAETVGTPAGVPWITAVGAAQDNEVFGTGIAISAPASVADTYIGLEGNGDVLLSDTGDISAEVIPTEPLDACAPLSNDLSGSIALAIRGTCSFSTKYNNAAAAGAQAIVVYNDGTSPTRIDPITMFAPGTTIPGIMISFTDGALLEATASGGETVTGMVGPSIVVSLDNRIAGFSSRGPNGGAPDIIKPDVAAPGVGILAAGSPFDAGGADDGQLFTYLSGTSMASPHAAGIFALLKEAHPDWTPAIAKSALMTTARQNLKKTFADEAADPFDIGAGHIVPDEAFDPGLAYDAGFLDYLAFSCENNIPLVSEAFCDILASLGFSLDGSDLNYPSIGIGKLVGSQTVTRTVTNVANNNGNKSFTVSIDAPPGIDVSVNPSTIKLKRGETATYEVTLTVTEDAAAEEWAFGSLTWSHGGEYSVRSPIAVKPAALEFPPEVFGAGTEGSLGFDIQFGYTGDYTAGTHGLAAPFELNGTVADDPNNSYDFPSGPGISRWFLGYLPGTAFARLSLFDEFTDGDDDLDLYVWECTAGCTLVGQSTTATSNETVDILLPKDGASAFYVVDVHGWQTDGPDANYTLFAWDFGLVDDRGNMAVDAPASATNGEVAPITVTWPALNPLMPGTKYLGAISHTGPDGLLGLTLINVDTN
jgi:subtilisin family serine protease